MGNKTSIAELAPLLTTPYSHLELGQVNDHAAYVMNFKDGARVHHPLLGIAEGRPGAHGETEGNVPSPIRSGVGE